MTNPYYTVSGAPIAQSRGASSIIRTELVSIQTGFDSISAAFGGVTGALIVSGTDGGAANAITITPTTALVSYRTKMMIQFVAPGTNTTAVTVNISGIGAVSVNAIDNTALVAGDLVSGLLYAAEYNGTSFVLLGPTKNYIDLALGLKANAANANLTGVPTAPTAAVGTNTTQIATMAALIAQAFLTALPSQTGNSGLFVTTNGSIASWASPLPNQSGNSGKFLTTNGTVANWGSFNQLAFGDGSDGNVTVTGSLTLTRDMYYNNLTLNSAAAINTAGYRINVAGTLDISAAPAGAIFWNGTSGSAGANGATSTTSAGGAGGAALTTANIGAGAAGATGGTGTFNGNGGVGNNSAVAQNGGPSSTSGAGGASSTNSGGAAGTNGASAYKGMIFPELPIGVYLTGTTFSIATAGAGGPGGGGGGAVGGATAVGGGGGGGGGAAGTISIAANIIARGSNVTAAIIQAKGGAGANGGNAYSSPSSSSGGGGGGGSGGGGGWVIIIFGSLTGTAITGAIDVSGGAGGAGGTGFSSGAATFGGTGGGSGGSGVIQMYNLGASQITTTATVAGSAGTAASSSTSTSAGGAGATINTKQVNL